MPDVIGTISLQLGIDRSLFDKQVNTIGPKTQKALGPIGVAVGNMVANLVQQAVVGIGNTIKSCIDLGSALEEVQNVVNVTFPTMTAEVDAWANSAITSFGLSEKVSKQYLSTLGTMAEAFGYTEGEALGMGETLTGLAGDMASFYNIDSEQAFNELKAVFTGETEALKGRGVVMTQAALDEFALAEGFGKTTNAMTEKEKVALRLAFVTNRLKNADGDFMRTSEGWANQTRVLSLRFDSLKASIGEGFIAMLTPLIRSLNSFMGVLQGAADSFAAFMKTVFNVQVASTAATSGMAGNVDALGSSADNAADAVGGIGSAAKEASKFLAGFDTLTKISSPASSGGGGGGGIGGSGSSVPIPTEAAASNNVISDSVQRLLDSLTPLKDAWDNLMESLKPLVETGRDFYDKVLEPIGKWVMEEGLPGFVNLLADFFTGLDPILDAVVQGLAYAWTDFFEPIASWVVGEGFDILGQFFIDVGQVFEDNPKFADLFARFVEAIVILSTVKFVAGGALTLFDAIKASGFVTGIARVADIIGILVKASPELGTSLGTLGAVAGTVLGIANGIVGWGGLLAGWDMTKIDSWITGYEDLWEWVGDEISMCLSLLDEITGLPSALGLDIEPFNEQVEDLPGLFDDAFENITGGHELSDYLTSEYDIVTGVWSKAKSFFGTVGTGAYTAIKTYFSPVTAFFQGVYDGITRTFGSLSTWFGEVVQLIKDKFSGSKEWFSSLFNGIYLAIKASFPVVGFIETTVGSIKTKISGIPESFRSAFAEGYAAVVRVLSPVLTFLDTLWSGITNKFRYVGTMLGDAIGGAFKTAFNAAIYLVEKTLNSVIDKINGGLGSLNKLIPGTANDVKSIGHLELPRLARGGVVNSPMLAMIGEAGREAVVPLENNMEWLDKIADMIISKTGGGGGGDIYINSPVYLSDTGDFVGMLVKHIARRQRIINA